MTNSCLYRHFDKAGNLLYVGVSNAPIRRTESHDRNSLWYEKIAYIELEWLSSWRAVLLAEKFAVKNEKPIYNICHGTGFDNHPRGKLGYLRKIKIADHPKIVRLYETMSAREVGERFGVTH